MIDFIAHNPILFYSIILFSSIISSAFGISGFTLIPLAALVFGPKESIGIITIYFISQNITKIAFFYKYINYPIAKKMIIWGLPGVFIGSIALSYIPEAFFEKFLALIAILITFNEVFKIFTKRTTASEKYLPFYGIFYGIASGLIGSGNMIKGPLYISLGLIKETYLGTYAFSNLFINLPKSVIYGTTGIITTNTLVISIPFIAISIIGTWIGKRLLKYISNKIFYYIMVIFFLFTAVTLLLK